MFDEEEAEPEEGDLTTQDHVRFFQDGRIVLTLQVYDRSDGTYRDAESGELSDEAMWRQIEAYMKETNFWPNVWFISDHGNAHLLTKPKRKRQRFRKGAGR
jgi:hypothetical protein